MSSSPLCSPVVRASSSLTHRRCALGAGAQHHPHAITRACKPAHHHQPATASACEPQLQREESAHGSSFPIVLSSLAASLAVPFLARAEETLQSTDATSLAAQAGDAASQGGSWSDTFVSIAFTIVIILLTVVTLGVAYLSLVSWLDQREENKARTETPSTPSRPAAAPKAQAGMDDKEEEELMGSLRRASSKRDKAKGFAALGSKGGASRDASPPPREF